MRNWEIRVYTVEITMEIYTHKNSTHNRDLKESEKTYRELEAEVRIGNKN